MAHEINENTQLTLDLKTIAIVIGGVASLILMYTTLQADIELAKELPKPEISRTEYDLKDELVRETIMNTQKKVDEIGSKLDKIEERLFKISVKE
jgi:Mg2+ and Co2+ transporter CorA